MSEHRHTPQVEELIALARTADNALPPGTADIDRFWAAIAAFVEELRYTPRSTDDEEHPEAQIAGLVREVGAARDAADADQATRRDGFTGEQPATACQHCGAGITQPDPASEFWLHLTPSGHSGKGRCQSERVPYGYMAHAWGPCPDYCLGSRAGAPSITPEPPHLDPAPWHCPGCDQRYATPSIEIPQGHRTKFAPRARYSQDRADYEGA